MVMLRAVAAGALLWVVSAGSSALGQEAGLRCGSVSVGGNPVCLETPTGLVFAPDRAGAERIRPYAVAGEQRFQQRFGRAPLPYAVVLGPVDKATIQALKAAGAKAVLPAHRPQQGAEANLRKAVETRGRELGKSAEEIQADVERVLKQSRERRAQAGDPDASFIPHELGHMWLMEAFWPGAAEVKDQYGAPGPDWLDEAAGLVLEDDATAEQRRSQFAHSYRTGGDELLLDLVGFVNLKHPLRSLPNANSGSVSVVQSTNGGPVTVMQSTTRQTLPPGMKPPAEGVTVQQSTAGPMGPLNDTARLYIQGRLFADFLFERSGDPGVLGHITRAHAAGGDLNGWLRRNTATHASLGADLEQMQEHWRHWLRAKYPMPSS